jgi:predicted branched-subunit amino acid permease
MYGTAFGAAAVAAGFSILQASAFSLLLFSGASQFAVVSVMGAGGSALSAITTGALLGIRNGLYGMRLAPILRFSGWRRLLGSHITIDESTGVALAQRDEESTRLGFLVTGVGVFISWNLFTLLGAVGAQALGNPSSWGLDAAVPAAFLGLVWPRLTSFQTKLAAGIAMVLALLLSPHLSAGLPIIATVAVAVFLGWRST